ncbi:MAG TPA: RNA-binding protein [Candidatus Woesearchaeota archaeon]|nr:RNA-binding protein [Candidatus Woesearchaeota archaeon]
MAKELCTSCKTDISNLSGTVHFKCPECSEAVIRCVNCRRRGVAYTCPSCGFTGP